MNLIEGMFKEMNRARDTVRRYEELGAPGLLGAQVINMLIEDAEQAIASGDAVRMLQAYKRLELVE